jgi:hypothetical protein
MKVLFRLLIIFGLIDLLVSFIESFYLSQVPSKLLIGIVCLCIGTIGLFVLRLRKVRK